MALAWGNKVDQEFREELAVICIDLGWKDQYYQNWLMACMAFESNETFSPSIRNMAGSGAVGLIQFMPGTARGLGTTTTRLAAMSAVEQLHYVKQYFRPYAKRIENLSDMYMAILMPKYISAPPSDVLFSGGVAYRQNSGLDADKDGKVTKYEAAARVREMLNKGMHDPYVLA